MDAGVTVKVRGVVEGHYRGRAVVQIPLAGGGAMGVPTDLEDLEVGDEATLEGTVVEERPGAFKVAFQTPDGATQESMIARERVEQ